MYSLIYSDLCLKQLKRLDKQAQVHILSVLERCRVRPHAFVKKLVGVPYYRLRAGDYRIIVDIKDSELMVFVIEVGHRRAIYK